MVIQMAYGKFGVALLLVGCGDAFSADFGVAADSDGGAVVEIDAQDETDAAGDVEVGATGGRVGSGGRGSGGAGSGGLVGVGGAIVGSGGASTGGSEGGAPVECLTDLSGVGTGDFRISFTITTMARMNVALLSQRIGCDQSSMLWGVTLSYTGQIAAATGDGVHWSTTAGANSVVDGESHALVFARTSGKIWISRDGVIDSIPVADPSSLGVLPPLRIGADDCPGFWSAQETETAISNVCVSH